MLAELKAGAEQQRAIIKDKIQVILNDGMYTLSTPNKKVAPSILNPHIHTYLSFSIRMGFLLLTQLFRNSFVNNGFGMGALRALRIGQNSNICPYL